MKQPTLLAQEMLRASPNLQRALLDVELRTNLVSFIRIVFETVVPGEALHLNWHIRAMAHVLEQVRLDVSAA